MVRHQHTCGRMRWAPHTKSAREKAENKEVHWCHCCSASGISGRSSLGWCVHHLQPDRAWDVPKILGDELWRHANIQATTGRRKSRIGAAHTCKRGRTHISSAATGPRRNRGEAKKGCPPTPKGSKFLEFPWVIRISCWTFLPRKQPNTNSCLSWSR